MSRRKKSVSGKRNCVGKEGERTYKRVCLEDFFLEVEKPESIVERFHKLMKKLEEEDVTMRNLANANRMVTQLKRLNLQQAATSNNYTKIITKLKFFLKNDFIKDFTLNSEGGDAHVKPDVEMVLEACTLCFFIFSDRKSLDSDAHDNLNDIVFFWRKMFDNLNVQISKVKNFNNARLKQLLRDSIQNINELIEICNFNLLNHSGLIKSFVHTVCHHPSLELQISALEAIKLLYKKGEELRALIINLTFNSIGSVNETCKFKKNYKIHNSLHVSAFTILMLSLVENVPLLDFHAHNVCDESAIQNVHNMLQESFETMMKVACFIAGTFIKKNEAAAVEHKAYSSCLAQLISEVTDMCNEPQWPSARLLLNLFLKPLTDILGNNADSHISVKTLAVKALNEVIRKKISDKDNYRKILESLSIRFKAARCERDFPEYLKTLLIGYLNKSARNSKYIHAMVWYDGLKNDSGFDKKMLELVKLVANNATEAGAVDVDVDEDEEMRATVYYLDTTRKNYADHQLLIKYLLLCCNDRVKKIKTLAARCILELATLDTDLLSQSVLLKVVLENLPSFPLILKRFCSIIDEDLKNEPEKSEKYFPLLLRLLDTFHEDGKKIYMDLIMRAVNNQLKLELKIQLVYKVLSFVQDVNPVTRKQVSAFCTELWLGEKQEKENMDLLLGVAEIPNAAKYLWAYFEDKLKTRSAAPVPKELLTQTIDSCERLLNQLLHKMKKEEHVLQCLQIISMIATAYPKLVVPHLVFIMSPLTRSKYSENQSLEILSAEIMNCILPEVADDEILGLLPRRNDLARKLSSPESSDYAMGLIASVLKLLSNLSKFDMAALFEMCLEPSIKILHECKRAGLEDAARINKSLCTAVYLHVYFPNECAQLGFPQLLQYFIQHRAFALTTVHCLCYLSMDCKMIMKDKTVLATIDKHLKDKTHPLLLKAVLYNILCSLKNISKGQLTAKCRGVEDSSEPVKNLVKNHIRDILDCTIDERTEIRHAAYAVVKQILVSGLMQESRLIPSVLLMSTDPIEYLSNLGLEAMRQIPIKKLFEFTRHSRKCIIACLVFHAKCEKKRTIRGYKVLNNGKVEALCNNFYVVHQEHVAMRRHVIDSVLKELSPEAETNAFEKLFLADNLLAFSYKYQEEVYYVLCQIDTVLASVKLADVTGTSDKSNFIDKYYGAFVLLFIKPTLMSYYLFSAERLRKYYQEDGKKDLVNTKKVFVSDMPQNYLPQEDCNIDLARIMSETFKNQLELS